MKLKPTFFFATFLSLVFITQSQAQQSITEDTAVNQPIQLIERVPPIYPSLALVHQIEGWVKVIFTIKADGQITDVGIVDASPAGVFEAAAMAAVKKFKISPPIKEGVAIDQRATQTIDFVLPDDFAQKTKELEEKARLDILKGDFDLSLMQPPDDLQFLITAIETESKIKRHDRSNRVLTLEVLPDNQGLPNRVDVITNEVEDIISGAQLTELKQEVLFYAKKSYLVFNGYYEPVYNMEFAKNRPATVEAKMVAKSMPVPDLRMDNIIQAELTIDADGNLIDIQKTQVNGDSVAVHLVSDIFKVLDYSPAAKNNRMVKDTIEITLTLSLVQKDHVELIRSEWLETLNQ